MTQDAGSKEQGVAWRGRVAKTFIEAVTQARDHGCHWLSSFFLLKHGNKKEISNPWYLQVIRQVCGLRGNQIALH